MNRIQQHTQQFKNQMRWLAIELQNLLSLFFQNNSCWVSFGPAMASNLSWDYFLIFSFLVY